jgi:hypothetical protein
LQVETKVEGVSGSGENVAIEIFAPRFFERYGTWPVDVEALLAINGISRACAGAEFPFFPERSDDDKRLVHMPARDSPEWRCQVDVALL